MEFAHGFNIRFSQITPPSNVDLFMVVARLDIPTIIVSGGPMLAGKVGGRKVDLSTVFEAVEL